MDHNSDAFDNAGGEVPGDTMVMVMVMVMDL